MDNTKCAEKCIKNEKKQNHQNEHKQEDKIIKELEVLKKLNDKILFNLDNYLSK